MPREVRPGYAPVIFDEAFWLLDLARASAAGSAIAAQTRTHYEAEGCPAAQWRKLLSEGDDGTRLPNCVKVYLPPPAGKFGMVFQLALDAGGRITLAFLAFGVRHHPEGSRAPTVYQLADRRLDQDRDR